MLQIDIIVKSSLVKLVVEFYLTFRFKKNLNYMDMSTWPGHKQKLQK